MKLPKFNIEKTEIFRQPLIFAAPPSLSFRDLTPQLLDSVTSLGVASLSVILLAVNPPRPVYIPCKDFWNEEFFKNRCRCLKARHSHDLDLTAEARKRFRKSVRRVKLEYKRSKLDSVSSVQEAH